ncbi:endoplasmic reticulum junction formation protein lunapark isoform X3 [Macrotis lagotis]|uniref:endoplasmic reticulum junction formation protein lunapark isoform X3 n=1 Tax=Macrotis lagotis TaxID=92651 RepID=UPI003D696EBC
MFSDFFGQQPCKIYVLIFLLILQMKKIEAEEFELLCPRVTITNGHLRIWTIRTVLIFFFSKRTERNNEALDDLKSQKKKILEEVMEKETYKTAKLILERFDPESRKAKELEPTSSGAAATSRPGQEIRQRTTAQRNLSPSTPSSPNQGSPLQVPGSPSSQKDTSAPGGPPERALAPALQSNALPRRLGSPATSMPGMGLHPPGPPLARPILPRERGALDRIVEYLVGDGPQNRYALICQQCFSHNGMALKEEFEYIAFRCAYCFFLNPARKTRPQAPRLPEFSFEKRQLLEGQSTVGPLQLGSTSQENQFIEGAAVPQKSYCLSEISGMKSNWLKLSPIKASNLLSVILEKSCKTYFNINHVAKENSQKKEKNKEESLEEQDVPINCTDQTDEKVSDTEQTNQINEKATDPMEQEDNIAEEAEKKETTVNEAKAIISNTDSAAVDEPNGESLMEIE